MTVFRLRYVQAFTDRHGVERRYFRKPGQRKVPLPGLPGSREFMEAYQAALAGEGAPKRLVGQERTKDGSLSALIVAYYQSAEYKNHAPNTKRNYSNMIDRLRSERGHLSVTGFKSAHALALLDEYADRQGAANNLRRVLRILMRFAVERGWRDDNPMAGLRRAKSRSSGYRTWADEDIALFEAHWPKGSRARLALALLLYTAQRRQDVVAMGRQHIRDGKIHVKQLKGDTRLALPIHQNLAEALTWAPAGQMTFLMTAQSKPFSAAGFTNWFSGCAKDAGLPVNSTPHGLRKAAARRLAEAGCSPHEIKAVTGHKNLSEVTLYTAAVDQERLAETAMKTVSGTSAVKPKKPVDKTA